MTFAWPFVVKTRLEPLTFCLTTKFCLVSSPSCYLCCILQHLMYLYSNLFPCVRSPQHNSVSNQISIELSPRIPILSPKNELCCSFYNILDLLCHIKIVMSSLTCATRFTFCMHLPLSSQRCLMRAKCLSSYLSPLHCHHLLIIAHIFCSKGPNNFRTLQFILWSG